MNAATIYTDLLAKIDSPENRNRRKGKVAILCSYAGGRSRYVWLVKDEGADVIRATLYGNEIAIITPESVTVDPCGEFTPSTRDAFSVIFPRKMVWMSTPGSKGGTPGPWTCTIGGVTFSERTTIAA